MDAMLALQVILLGISSMAIGVIIGQLAERLSYE
jgi:hypothetical protein